MGVFGNWRFKGTFERPDTAFKKSLEKNPVFPFEELDPNVYVLSVRSAHFEFSLMIICMIIGGTIIVNFQIAPVGQMAIFPMMVLVGYVYEVVRNSKHRTYVLDLNTKMYEYYRGKRLVYQGHFHNCYIRLKGQATGGGDTFYNIVLNGYMMEEEEITNAMCEPKRLLKYGRKLAGRLNLNFFEDKDKSRGHDIRHRCPYSLDAASSSKSDV